MSASQQERAADGCCRQREADRAPALVVLSLPERVWTPDIIWEKDDESDAASVSSRRSRTSPTTSVTNVNTSSTISPTDSVSGPDVPPPPPISPSDIRTPPAAPAVQLSIPGEPSESARPSSSRHDSQQRKKKRSKSGGGKKYFSKDECAICMDSFQKGEVVRILPCGHVFHKEECDEWLMKWRKLVSAMSAVVVALLVPLKRRWDVADRIAVPHLSSRCDPPNSRCVRNDSHTCCATLHRGRSGTASSAPSIPSQRFSCDPSHPPIWTTIWIWIVIGRVDRCRRDDTAHV